MSIKSLMSILYLLSISLDFVQGLREGATVGNVLDFARIGSRFAAKFLDVVLVYIVWIADQVVVSAVAAQAGDGVVGGPFGQLGRRDIPGRIVGRASSEVPGRREVRSSRSADSEHQDPGELIASSVVVCCIHLPDSMFIDTFQIP